MNQNCVSGAGYLALDVGTHAVKACVISRHGELGRILTQPIDLLRLDDHRVEQDAEQVLRALKSTIVEACSTTKTPILGLGLAVQRSTVVAWNKHTGRAESPALSWQDTRCYKYVASLLGHRLTIEQRSGLVLSAHYGASKIRWLQDDFLEAHTCISPLVSYLVFNILEDSVVICDESNAARTQLWNINERRWDVKLCKLFDINIDTLPKVRPTIFHYGNICRQLSQGRQVCLNAVIGDQNAAFIGVSQSLCPSEGSAPLIVNLGSGAFVLADARQKADGERSAGDSLLPKGLLRSVSFSDEHDCYRLLEGTVNGAGLALTWLASLAEMEALGGEQWLLSNLPSWLDRSGVSSVLFYNSVGGLGSPYWSSGVGPFFEPNDASVEEKAVAVIESIVFLLAINIEKMQTVKYDFGRVHISGGLSRLDGLCQRVSNILWCNVDRGSEREVTLLGAATLASHFKVRLNGEIDRQFTPVSDRGLLHRFECFKMLIAKKNYRLVAHRGYAAVFPENSLLAIDAGLSAGVEAVEFDIQMSRDGVPVVIHDSDLMRLAGVSGQVSDYTYTELEAMSVHEPERLGDTFFPTKIPGLSEIPKLVQEYESVRVFAEIKPEIFEKNDRAEALRKIIHALKPILKVCTIISRDLHVLRMVQKKSLCSVGWVLSEYNQDSYSQVKSDPVDILICNFTRFPSKEVALWDGPWQWFCYEITSQEMLNECLRRGVTWIESRDAVGLMV